MPRIVKNQRTKVASKSEIQTQNSEETYFQRLKFNPALLGSVVAKYIGNMRLVALLVLTIVLMGSISFFSLPQRLNPEVKIPIVMVVTALPGASPEDVETLVTVPLENELKSAEGLDQITSVSNENVSMITLQFLSTVDVDQAKDDVQSRVDSVRELPDDAQDPQVNALDFEDQPIWTFAITTEGDPRTLMTFAQELQTSLEELSKVDRVVTSGFEKQEVVVALKPEKVQQYGLNPLLLSQSIQKSVSSYPAGTVETSNNAFSLTIAPSLTSIDDLRQIKVSFQGETYALGDIAQVSAAPKPNQQIAFLAKNQSEPQRAVTFYVYKSSAASINDAGKEVEVKVEEILQRYGETYTLTTVSNTSELISEQFTDLLGEFRSTMILVFVCLLIFLGLRQAMISSLTVPLTFLSAFIFMSIFKMSINFLSLFAFLLALGLLVDDTIVIVSAMTSYYKVGKFNPLQTGLLVWKDTIVPIWSTTITTIWSFVPLLLTTGIIGEFIKPIPIVVTVTMISSTAIAVLVTLPIMILILKPQVPGRVTLLLKILGVIASLGLLFFFVKDNPLLPAIGITFIIFLGIFALIFKGLKKRVEDFIANNTIARTVIEKVGKVSDKGLIDLHGFSQAYYRFIFKILSSKTSRRKVVFGIVVYAVVGFLLLPLGFVKNEFFPKTDGETVYINLELPAGTSLSNTEQEALKLLADLKNTPDTTFVTAEVGRGLSGFGGASNSQNITTFTLHLAKKEDRERQSFEVAEAVREQYKNYTVGKLNVVEESGGPPAGADIQIQLLGDDLDQLNGYAARLTDFLKNEPGAINVESSFKTGTTQLVFIPDQNKLVQAGVSVDSVALWLRMYASGFTLDSINLDPANDEKEDVVFRFDVANPEAQGLGALMIPTQTGASYPLLSLGSLETRANPTQITRDEGTRTITVTAAAQSGFSATETNQKLVKAAEELQLPQGYSWKTGGANEENQKSINSILQAMVVSAILILVTMVIQFNSFRQAFIVLIVIPLAVSSVFYVFSLFGIPLSFPALIGVLSLFGIVVTNSMFIVDKINLNLKEGLRLKEAIADAGASRMEPIILTKLCTVLGLLPITIADPLWRGLGGAIIAGLLLASTIMLLFIPSLYYMLFATREKKATNS